MWWTMHTSPFFHYQWLRMMNIVCLFAQQPHNVSLHWLSVLNFLFFIFHSLYIIIGASLSEPHIDRDNSPCALNNGMYVCMYVSIYLSFTPRLSHPGSRDPCTSWNAPCSPVYWRAHVRDFMHSTEQQLKAATLPWRRPVGECADTWYKRIQPTETVEL